MGKTGLVDQTAVDREIDAWLTGKGLAEGASLPAPAPSAPAVPEHPLTAELLQPVITFPFTAAAIMSNYGGFELAPSEASVLTQAWLAPLKRLLPASQSIDLVIAVTVTMGVLSEKYMLYRKDKALEKTLKTPTAPPAVKSPPKPNGDADKAQA